MCLLEGLLRTKFNKQYLSVLCISWRDPHHLRFKQEKHIYENLSVPLLHLQRKPRCSVLLLTVPVDVPLKPLGLTCPLVGVSG